MCAVIKIGSRRSQVQLMENIGVLIVVTIFLFSGYNFYYRIQAGNLDDLQDELLEKQTVAKLVDIYNFAELHCSFAGITNNWCFDYYKVKHFAAHSDQAYYHRRIGYGEVVITRLVDSPQYLADFDRIVLYAHERQGEPTIVKTFSVPIVVQDPLSEKRFLSELSFKSYYYEE